MDPGHHGYRGAMAMDSDQLVAMYRALLPILEIDFDTEVKHVLFLILIEQVLSCRKVRNVLTF